jgi:Tfp pilus assembly protein PilF
LPVEYAAAEPSAPPAADRTPSRWKWQNSAIASVSLAILFLSVWVLAHRTARSSPALHTSSNATPSLPSAPADTRAKELYLHGSYLFEQRTPETLQQARRDFQAAIAASPQYAPAYAGLAKTYDLLREYATLPSAQAYPLARRAAQQAIALDPRLPDAHAALGYEEFFWEWDAPHAEAEFKQAIALDPNSSLAHHWYGSMLTHQTRYAEALDQLNQAQMLAPDSAGVLGTRAYAIGLSGKRDQAADLVQDILTRSPDSAPLHFVLANLCLQEPRDIPRYLDQMRRFAELRHSDEELALLKAGEPAYRELGETKMWQTMLQAERKLHPDPDHPTYSTLQLEAVLGMREDALRDLALLARDHDEQMVGIDIDVMLSSLRDDPQFKQIARQVGLPDPPQTRLSVGQ